MTENERHRLIARLAKQAHPFVKSAEWHNAVKALLAASREIDQERRASWEHLAIACFEEHLRRISYAFAQNVDVVAPKPSRSPIPLSG